MTTTITQAIRAIEEDIALGTFPRPHTFAEIHTYLDANIYIESIFEQGFDATGTVQGAYDAANKAIEAIDKHLAAHQ